MPAKPKKIISLRSMMVFKLKDDFSAELILKYTICTFEKIKKNCE